MAFFHLISHAFLWMSQYSLIFYAYNIHYWRKQQEMFSKTWWDKTFFVRQNVRVQIFLWLWRALWTEILEAKKF